MSAIINGEAEIKNKKELSETVAERSHVKAVTHLSAKVENQGHLLAQYRLGVAYWKGEGVLVDKRRAVELWKVAAEDGLAEAQFGLGFAFEGTEGIQPNLEKAAKWYYKAALQEYAPAQHNLAMLLKNGHLFEEDRTVNEVFKEAFDWFQKAAKQGHGDAQNELGLMYQEGVWVQKDIKLACYWYQQAEAQMVECYCTPAELYSKFSKEEDLWQLYEWCLEASEKNNAEALYILGLFNKDGRIVVKDLEKAFAFFKKSLENGYEKAIDKLDTYFKGRIPPTRGDFLLDSWQFPEALEFFENGLKRDLRNSYYICGKGEALYCMGRYKEALECFEAVIKLRPEFIEPLYLKAIRGSFNRNRKISNLLKIEGSQLQYMKSTIKDGEFRFEGRDPEWFESLVMLLLENHPITKLTFIPVMIDHEGNAAGTISLEQLETLCIALLQNSTAAQLNFCYGNYQFCSKELEFMSKALRGNYTLQEISFRPNDMSNEKDIVKTIETYLERNKNYPATVRKKILTSFKSISDRCKSHLPSTLQNIVCAYACYENTVEPSKKVKC